MCFLSGSLRPEQGQGLSLVVGPLQPLHGRPSVEETVARPGVAGALGCGAQA